VVQLSLIGILCAYLSPMISITNLNFALPRDKCADSAAHTGMISSVYLSRQATTSEMRHVAPQSHADPRFIGSQPLLFFTALKQHRVVQRGLSRANGTKTLRWIFNLRNVG